MTVKRINEIMEILNKNNLGDIKVIEFCKGKRV